MKSVSSALSWAAIALLVLAALPVMAVIRVFDRTPARLHTGRMFRRVGAWVTMVNPAWRVRVERPVPPRPPVFVAVSNHQSMADIPVVCRLPWEMKWVAKKAIFDFPVMGWLMKLAGDIPVDRKDPASRATVLTRARDVLDRGAPVMFFPEGTRSRDGRFKTFHDGAFRLAIEAGVPVLPIALDGTMDVIPKFGWRFTPAHVRLAVLPPVPTAGLTVDDVPALRDRVRGLLLDHVAAWRGVPAATVDGLVDAPDRPETATTGEERAKSTVADPRPGVGG